MRTVVQIVAGLLCVALTAGFLWGQRAFLQSMGEQFLWGYLAGAVTLFVMQWALWKLSGETLFPSKPDATRH